MEFVHCRPFVGASTLGAARGLRVSNLLFSWKFVGPVALRSLGRLLSGGVDKDSTRAYLGGIPLEPELERKDAVTVPNEEQEEWWLNLHFDGWRECPAGPCMGCERGAP